MIVLSSFFNILYIVLAIFGILALGGLSGKDREKKKKELAYKDVEINYWDTPDPIASDYFKTYVGGARFYTDSMDMRCFAGFVYYDPEDEAPRIYRNDMRMLGHIPRERLKEYVRWCPGVTFPCVGYIMRGKTAEELVTELRVIKPYNSEYVENEIKKYVGWVVMTHGMGMNIVPEKYVPLLSEAEIVEQNKQRKQKNDIKL